MTRALAMLAVALTLAGAADATAQPRAQKAPPAAPELPLHIYLAKGEPNACGEGCQEWIAVEGRFDTGSAGRINAFLKRHGARKLPVYFSSPGGSSTDALAIGRQLRQFGLTTGVARTVPRACASANDRSNACRAAKRTGQAVAAEWRPDAICNSACVWALLGGKVRHVPPAARLGVHAGRVTLLRKYSDGRVQQLTSQQAPSLHKSKAAEFDALNRRYIREMGVAVALFDVALKVPHEDIHYLSRDQIAAFGIDRREFEETPWFVSQYSSSSIYLSKWIVEARGPARQDYRVSVIFFTCSGPLQASLRYMRGLASDEVGRPATATLTIGKHRARLALSGAGTQRDAVDTGALFALGSSQVPFDDVAAAAAHGSIGLTEADPRADAPPRVTALSTQGLAGGLKLLRAKCVPAEPRAPWAAEGTQVPFVPAQAGNESTPAAPYGAYPAPDWGLGTSGKSKK